MPDPYTYIGKPTDSNYSYINFEGKQTYDQSNVSYDDASVFYDSYNPNSYTLISKPGGNSTITGGTMNGLMMPLTYSYSFGTPQAWTIINKPS